MTGKISRRPILKSRDNKRTIENYEEFGSEPSCENGVVVDIAKGFAEAQANINNNLNDNNQQILNLLQKVTSQLDKLQGDQGQNLESSSTSGSMPGSCSEYFQTQSRQELQQPQQQQNGQQQYLNQKQQTVQKQAQQGNNQSQQNESQVTQQLKDLFSQVLLNTDNFQGQGSQSSLKSSSSEGKNDNKTSAIAVQTAGQVLAKAQYELANELEASLKKLKQVISESEKIADQISNLLGESSNKKS